MRQLFLSEHRCISNLMLKEWETRILSEPRVVSEFVAPPTKLKSRPLFNCDFMLEFVHPGTNCEHASTMSSVLPNTLGAELYLVASIPDYAPMMLQLITGAAFSIKYYSRYIADVEAAIALAAEEQSAAHPERLKKSLYKRGRIEKAASLRLLVIGGDATFLFSHTDDVPTMRGERVNLARAADREIDCYLDDDQIVCFDGWVRTEIPPRGEGVLVSIPREHADGMPESQ